MDRNKFDQLMNQSEAKSEEIPMLNFNMIEAHKLNLQPNDVLLLTIKNDNLDQHSVDGLKEQLSKIFTNNKVMVLAVGSSDDVNISIVSQSETGYCGDGNYCNDCTCGKKEAALNGENHG